VGAAYRRFGVTAYLGVTDCRNGDNDKQVPTKVMTLSNADTPTHRYADTLPHSVLLMLRSEMSDEDRNRFSALLRHSCTRPDWILLGFEGGALTKLLVLAAPGNLEFPVEIIPFYREPGSRNHSALLFESAIEKAGALGARELFCCSQADSAEEALLCEIGFQRWRNVVRFDDISSAEAEPSNFQFASVGDFKREAIVALVAETSESSADLQIELYRERLGEMMDAEMTLQVMESTRYDPSWWRVAVRADGKPIGVIFPVIAFGEPTVGFVGVSAKHRGRGVGSGLLSEARSVMRRHGYSTLLAETDARNLPMHRALAKSGFARRWQKQEWRFSFAG
jgi:GNAT superfamily N-acetyltransferase